MQIPKKKNPTGSPRTIAEARAVVNDKKILADRAFVQDLILWLCDEIERHDAKDPDPIPKETLLDWAMGRGGKQKLAGSLFLSAFAKAFPIDKAGKIEKDKDAKKLCDAKEISLVLVANGVPMDAASVCVEWDKQVDRMIAEKAAELLEDQMGTVRETAESLDRVIKDAIHEFRKKNGIPKEDE